ncbi:VCBS repeat-containing protein [Streptomyces sp. NBC_01077]|uniref:FG-GAP repeat domain-containing protein n=1 Tax=Streptomyces sp. NBC_01077 TaxID=2903746 RepID=UPI00386ED1E0|nr:VCBS repeat-containing protein [Streptomyces sp. NBC_01077]
MTSRTARRRLSAAVATALAVTAGAALVTAPNAAAAPTAPGAVAASGAALTAAGQEAPVVLPRGTEVMSAGPSGYLTSTEHYDSEGQYSYTYTWFRADGSSTVLVDNDEYKPALPNAIVSDVVAVADTYDYRVLRLHDMSAPAGTAPVVIELNKLGANYKYLATIGSTLLVQVTPASGPKELHLVSKSGSTVSDRRIIGVPAGLDTVERVTGRAGTALVSYRTSATDGNKPGLMTLDLASAAFDGTYPAADTYRPTALSADKVVRWQGKTLMVADRATGAETPIEVGEAGSPLLGLVGGWVAYGTGTQTGGGEAGDAMLPLRARSLTGDRTVKLLDRASSVVSASDDALLVRGGTVEKGEGVYRITLGTDGVPAAELIASSGESTALTFTSTNIGPVVDLDPMHNRFRLNWVLSHDNFDYTVELIHKKTGRRYHHEFLNQRSADISHLWRGNFAYSEGDPGESAYNGDYTWVLTAKPTNGIGPDLRATGDFKLARTPKVHDFNDNGSPDLFARDSYGDLRRLDTVYNAWKARVEPADDPYYVGRGWDIYHQIESVGDVAGTSGADLVAVDKSGVLWLHQGTGDEVKPFADRVRIGPGWQVYTQLAGGSDLTGDGRPDLVASDTAGDLWLYKATGNAAAPFAPRKKIGFGWGIYNQLTAVGNLAGGPAGDLVARDKDGVLWLYLGKGDGTFAARTGIGAGWNQYSHLVGVGDATMDGRTDLYVYGPDNTSYVYSGTGSWRAPFATRVPSDVLLGGSGYNHVS